MDLIFFLVENVKKRSYGGPKISRSLAKYVDTINSTICFHRQEAYRCFNVSLIFDIAITELFPHLRWEFIKEKKKKRKQENKNLPKKVIKKKKFFLFFLVEFLVAFLVEFFLVFLLSCALL